MPAAVRAETIRQGGDGERRPTHQPSNKLHLSAVFSSSERLHLTGSLSRSPVKKAVSRASGAFSSLYKRLRSFGGDA
eukprot:15190633-Ditylum_brightwellii.AAC.1